MLVESFKCFDPPTTKWRPFKFFAKWNGNHISMASFSKLCKYQTFALIKLHNFSKGWLADRIFSYEKVVFTMTGSSNKHFLKFWHFNFSKFQTNFVKIFTKKPLGFKIDFESTKFYYFINIYDLKFLDNETTALWIFF